MVLFMISDGMMDRILAYWVINSLVIKVIAMTCTLIIMLNNMNI